MEIYKGSKKKIKTILFISLFICVFIIGFLAGCYVRNDDTELAFDDKWELKYAFHNVTGYLNDYDFNWGKGGYQLYFVGATIDGKDFCSKGNQTLHWFSDLNDFELKCFVGKNITIWYYNDLEHIYPDWNGNKYSVIQNIEKSR